MRLYYQIKKLVPLRIKVVLWHIFKSPQRKLGKYTWLIDTMGITTFFSRSCLLFFLPFRLKHITICTGLKNRSDNYLNLVLESIQRMKHRHLVTLSVFDCHSTDIENLQEAIRKKWDGPLVFQSEEIAFSRSYAFNKAVDQAPEGLIFISDADMSLPANLVRLCNRYVSYRNVWFPVCFKLNEGITDIAGTDTGEWYPVGKGMLACNKKDFISVGKLDTAYTTWGYEDWDLWYRFYSHWFFPLRTRTKGLLHHYHPSEKKLLNK